MRAIALVSILLALTACSALKRDPACAAADKCDQALQEPFGSFAANDPVFGDDLDGNAAHAGLFGNVGTCWQSADTAKPCVDQCKQFTAEQLALGQANADQGVIAACGGNAGGEGEGEGEGEGGQ